MINLIKTLEPNTAGRDFVIGDLHGAFPALVNLLENVKFDGEKDRLISVGDLVDRGPDSLNCLRLLREPWFHCVLANHEQMMFEAFNGGYMGNFWLRNGGNWGLMALTEAKGHPGMHSEETLEVLELLERVGELPYLITVKHSNGKLFHVIHAELPPPGPITDADLASEEKMRELEGLSSADGTFLVWGRHAFYYFYDRDVSNVKKLTRMVQHQVKKPTYVGDGHIISGHTILRRPITIFNHTNIDTGAWLSTKEESNVYALTAVELGSWKFYQATHKQFREIEPIVIGQQEIDNLKPNEGDE